MHSETESGSIIFAILSTFTVPRSTNLLCFECFLDAHLAIEVVTHIVPSTHAAKLTAIGAAAVPFDPGIETDQVHRNSRQRSQVPMMIESPMIAPGIAQ